MSLKAILLDADGTLWRGGEAIPGAPEFISRCRRNGVRCILASNNAAPNREAYTAKCRRIGLDFGPEDIFSVNHLAGPFLARHYQGRRILVIGSEMLLGSILKHTPAVHADAWLEEHGAGQRLYTPDDLKLVNSADFDVVIIGIDANASYIKLALACVAVQRGAVLIGANPDYSFPFTGDVMLPGNGSIVSLVSGVCGVEPTTYLGKPTTHLLEQVEEETGIRRHEMVMAGDRIETDIQMAADAGMPGHLILSGVSTREDAARSGLAMEISETLAEMADKLGIPE